MNYAESDFVDWLKTEDGIKCQQWIDQTGNYDADNHDAPDIVKKAFIAGYEWASQRHDPIPY